METKGSDQIHPKIYGHKDTVGGVSKEDFKSCGGLTKREYFANSQMAALWSNSVGIASLRQDADYEKVQTEAFVAKVAVNKADALIKALNLKKGRDDLSN